MSSLQENVSRRRAAEAREPECVSPQAGNPALVICCWEGGRWVLPWAQFVVARLDGVEGEGPLVISFANHVVTVTGENLTDLVDDLAAQRVGCLRDLPPQYRLRTGERTLFVSKIEIRETP